MKHTRLSSMFCGIMLAMSVMTGCVSMPDGSTGPDYDAIALGSVLTMTVLVNEVKSTQAVKDITHARLVVLHDTLSCQDTAKIDCPPLSMKLVPEMIANALPMEYRALAPAMISYIESKARLYYDVEVPQSENMELIRQITIVVIGGVIQALAPHVSQ